MPQRIPITIAACLLSLLSHAQDLDTLVYFHDLNFRNTFEKRAFERIYDGEAPEMEDLFLGITVQSENEAERFKTRLASLRSSLQRDGVGEKKDKKRIKVVYESVHEALMVKYREKAFYPELFRDGSFNCVSGTMVYSLMFDAFDIPYQIQKGMNHVYLLAFPDTEPMVVESTDSQKGLRKYSASDQQEYVRQLQRGKLISARERDASSVEALFLEYAFEEDKIDHLELASYQYLNKGLLHMLEKQQGKAFTAFEKAHYLKPQESTAQLLLITGASILHQADHLDTADYHLLGKLSRFKEYGITSDDVGDEFYRITEKVFLEAGDSALYAKSFEILGPYVSDPETLGRITDIYYWIQIEKYREEGEIEAALPLAELYYAYEPEDEDLHGLVFEIYSAMGVLQDKSDYEAVLDLYHEFVNAFPTVFDDPALEHYETVLLMQCSAMAFHNDDSSEGLRYISLFEQEFDRDILSDHHSRKLFETCYEEAAFYHYNRGAYSRARATLDRGLALDPENYRLKYLRRSL